MTAHAMKATAKKEASKAVKSHEGKMHKDSKKMKAGGPTSLDMKKYGRGMAKVMNQRSVGRGR